MHEVGHDSRYARECEFHEDPLHPLTFFFFIGEAGKLLPHMIQFTDEHRREGKALQTALAAFQEELSKAIEEVWTRPAEGVTAGANATVVNLLPGVGEAMKPQDPLEKIAKPQLVEPTWRVVLWDRK